MGRPRQRLLPLALLGLALGLAGIGCGTENADTVGPNLDESIADQSQAAIEESIVKPDTKIAKGFAPGLMPSSYEQIIPADELKALVEFLAKAASPEGAQG